MAAPAAEQMNGVFTELTGVLGPLQQLLGRGMAGVIAAGCDRKQLPWQQLGEAVQQLWLLVEQLKKRFGWQQRALHLAVGREA